MKVSLSATFIDERFNIFQKVYLKIETSLKKEALQCILSFPNPKSQIADIEKTGGKFGRWETHISKFDFSEAKETGNLAQVSIL